MNTQIDPLEHVAQLFSRILRERQAQEDAEPVVPPLSPGELRQRLDLGLPDQGQDLETVGELLSDLVRHTPTTASSSFFNQLFGGREPASLLGETVAAALNGSMYTYKIGGPQILVELELIREMGRRMGFADADGTFTPGGSLSNLAGMLVARDRARPDLHRTGYTGPRLRIYTSKESHYSVAKAVHILGLGSENLVRVAVDGRGRMLPEVLEAAIQADLDAGHEPMMVNATAGTTVLGAFDPLPEIADVCDAHDLWLHVDGAYGGSAVLDPGQAHHLEGSERADSVAWDAHKLMGAQLSCSVVLVREKGHLEKSLNESASYLFQADSNELNPGTRSIQCGRRNDALKLWTLWQSLGNEGLAKRLAGFRKLALLAADLVKKAPDLRLVRRPEFLNICFDVDGVCAEKLCAELNERGLGSVGYAMVDGKAVVRLVIVSSAIDEEALRAHFGHLRRVAADLRRAAPVSAAS